jgi:hypothetical protein
MTMRALWISARLLMTVFVSLAALGASHAFAPTAQAILMGCRSDPLIVLSDGTILDVSVSIDTHVANVTEIHYVVHGPSNASLVAAIRTPILGFSGKEVFTYIADAQADQYITETLVHTVPDQIGVTAYTTFSKASLAYSPLLSLQYKPVRGFNAQILRAVLTR